MNVVIFSSHLLPPSQTFIKAQGEKLRHFTPYYVGSRLVKGLNLPPERTLVINQGGVIGKAEETLFKVSGFAPKLYQQLHQLNPCLIHAQFGLSGILALPLARSLNVPLLVHFRGADATLTEELSRYASLNHWLYFQRREVLKQEATLFITVSKFIQKKLIEQGFPPEKIKPHYHGVDLESFSPQPDIPREPVVLFVGRLTEKKGCDFLIRAMARVQTEVPLELVFIGDGPLRSQLEASAAKQLRRFRFLGLQPPETVKSWMNRASILAAPSVTAADGDSEGLPNVVLEAQAMALPVVSTFHAGIPEAVIHGETGLLSAERDWERLADHILQLTNPQKWQRFSIAGRNHVEAHFDRAKQTQALEEIYLSIVNNTPSQPKILVNT